MWPEILDLISDCNITNYSIFLKEPENLLFGYWEYTGSDFDADMAKMAAPSEKQGMVVGLHALPKAAVHTQRRGVVGNDGRGFSS